jgi:putative transposase
MSAPDRRAMLDRAERVLSLRRQCALLGVARSSVYRPATPANDNDAALMRQIDELFTAWPFLGSRRMTAMLRAEGVLVNRKRVQRLMRLMGIAALGPKPRTSKPAPGHRIYPYLLRDMAIERANHVWAADITYIPIGRGFLYRGDHRLGVARGARVAAVEHDGRLVLPFGARGGSGEVRQAGDLQHRPGLAIHLGRLHRRPH